MAVMHGSNCKAKNRDVFFLDSLRVNVAMTTRIAWLTFRKDILGLRSSLCVCVCVCISKHLILSNFKKSRAFPFLKKHTFFVNVMLFAYNWWQQTWEFLRKRDYHHRTIQRMMTNWEWSLKVDRGRWKRRVEHKRGMMSDGEHWHGEGSGQEE